MLRTPEGGGSVGRGGGYCHHTPSYLFSLINTQPTRSNRSSSLVSLRRPPATRSKLSDRSFHHYIPRLWETLPPDLRLPHVSISASSPHPFLAITRSQFLSKLKTHLFTQSYPLPTIEPIPSAWHHPPLYNLERLP